MLCFIVISPSDYIAINLTSSESISLLHHLFLHSLTYIEKVLFEGQIFEMEILMNLQVLWPIKSDNHIISSWFVPQWQKRRDSATLSWTQKTSCRQFFLKLMKPIKKNVNDFRIIFVSNSKTEH